MSHERERERFLEPERCRERRRGFISSFSESLFRLTVLDSFFVVVVGISVVVVDGTVVVSFLLPLMVSVKLAISLMGMIGLISFSDFRVFMLGLGGLVFGITGVI